MSTQPIADKAEIAIEFPEKAYMGAFGRESRFDAAVESDSVMLRLSRAGDHKREVVIHLHFYLLADILQTVAASLRGQPPIDAVHREPLERAVAALHAALRPPARPRPPARRATGR
ncbi:MAG: hypothetical protein IT561_03440 [Alphaproteobacteria bacterium]|nr:hypothetical protein [Alphaproteobacteria bacterium]